MRYETVEVRIGEAVGPIDWEHDTAKTKPPLWREAERNPASFLYNGRSIVQICMYDGWPYWRPRPAIQYMGPIGVAWTFFDSYGVHDGSIERRR